MRSFLLDKLIRDNIFTSMQALGQQVEYHRLTDDDFLVELKKKLLEEANEFINSTDQAKALDELADLLEVIEFLGKELNSDFEALRNLQAERRAKNGGFADRIYVERVSLKNDDPWVEYYAANPDRFPEIQGSE